MAKWSIRDRWGKLTEKKELKPEMRDMLLRLDGVYQQPRESSAAAEDEPAPDETDRSAA